MILIITEKPDQTRSFSKALNAKYDKVYRCYKNSKYFITNVIGHMMRTDIDNIDVKWNTNLEIPEKLFYKPMKDKIDQINIIKNILESKDIEYVINAADSSIESEGIVRLVLDYLGCNLPIKRFWTSQVLNKNNILYAMNNLKDQNFSDEQYQRFNTRAKLDYVIGMNSSSKVSIISKSKNPLSLGRVQTPTLFEIYKRCKSIKNFKSSSSYRLILNINYDGKNLKLESEKTFEKDFIDNKDLNLKSIKLISDESYSDYHVPGLLYNKTNIVNNISKSGYVAGEIDKAGQSLYETRKVMTYYRTPGQYLDSNPKTKEEFFRSLKELDPTLEEIEIDGEKTFKKKLQNNSEFILYGLTKYKSYIFNSKKLQESKADHHAIFLTNLKNNMNHKYNKIEFIMFNRIKDRMMELSYGALEKDNKKIIISVYDNYSKQDIIFSVVCSQVTNPGYSLYRNNTDEYNHYKDFVSINFDLSKVIESNLDIHEVKSRCPAYYIDGSIFKWMERVGIGTPASMTGVLKRLLDCQYVERYQKNKLKITNKGEKICESLKESKLIDSKLTKDLEDVINEYNFDKSVPIINEIYESLDNCKDLLDESNEIIKCYSCENSGKFTKTGSLWCDKCNRSISKKLLGVSVSKDCQINLFTGKKVFLKNMTSSKGKIFSSYVSFTKENNIKFDFK